MAGLGRWYGHGHRSEGTAACRVQSLLLLPGHGGAERDIDLLSKSCPRLYKGCTDITQAHSTSYFIPRENNAQHDTQQDTKRSFRSETKIHRDKGTIFSLENPEKTYPHCCLKGACQNVVNGKLRIVTPHLQEQKGNIYRRNCVYTHICLTCPHHP